MTSRRIWIFAIVLLVISTVPYWVAAAHAGDGWRFSGFLIGVEDGHSYLGKMRLGARGQWDFSLFYTTEPHEAASLLYLPYIAAGFVIGGLIPVDDPAYPTAAIAAFHGLRIGCAALLLVVLYRFIAVFIRSERGRLVALILATLGGGFGWLLPLIDRVPPEFYIPEGFGFLILFSLPHVALARAALLGGLLAVIAIADGQQKGRAAALYSALAALCWVVVGLAVPFYLAILYCILGVWGLTVWLRERAFPRRLFIAAAAASAATLPLFLYFALTFTNNPAFALWSAQNQLPSPPLLDYAVAYGLLAALAAGGAGWAWQRGRLHTRFCLLIGWPAIVPLLVYLPINVQRRMAEAVIVPLAILAAAGLERWMSRRTSSSRRRLAFALVGAACVSAGLLWLVALLAASVRFSPVFRPPGEVEAFLWLNQHGEAGAAVLTSMTTGNALPAYADLRPYVGHGPETLEAVRKNREMVALFTDDLTAEERAALYGSPCLIAAPTLCADPPRYLIYGDPERLLAREIGRQPSWVEEWMLVYETSYYAIFERNPALGR
ncbi:MAG: hypothetical protein SNJ59_12845 [Aggregatilineales bacterium]